MALSKAKRNLKMIEMKVCISFTGWTVRRYKTGVKISLTSLPALTKALQTAVIASELASFEGKNQFDHNNDLCRFFSCQLSWLVDEHARRDSKYWSDTFIKHATLHANSLYTPEERNTPVPGASPLFLFKLLNAEKLYNLPSQRTKILIYTTKAFSVD